MNGNLFDKAMKEAYEYTQIHMANGKVLDAFVPDVEIVSHKFTQLKNIKFDTAKGYVNELVKKYGNEMTDSRKLEKQISTIRSNVVPIGF